MKNRTFKLFAAVALAFGLCSAAQAQIFNSNPAIEGRVSRVADGDTFTIAGQSIRLWGVDALEKDQECRAKIGGNVPCGAVAAEFLIQMIAQADGGVVRCAKMGNSYNRVVADCRYFLGGREHSVSREMVASGYAFDCPSHSKGRFADAENEARQSRRGVWAGQIAEFEAPWMHRAAKNPNSANACGRGDSLTRNSAVSAR